MPQIKIVKPGSTAHLSQIKRRVEDTVRPMFNEYDIQVLVSLIDQELYRRRIINSDKAYLSKKFGVNIDLLEEMPDEK